MTSEKQPSIVVLSGPQAGAVLTIAEALSDYSIGSDNGCHLVLPGDDVSPIHAKIFRDDDGSATVTDARSFGGVYVNGERIKERVLNPGDEISIGPPGETGSVSLRFDAAGASDSITFEEPLALPSDDLAFEPAEAALPELSLDPIPSFDDTEAPAEESSEIEEAPAPLIIKGAAPVLPMAPTPKAAAKVTGGSDTGSARKGPKVGAADDVDDPLAGLAESLGGDRGGRFVPPPPVMPAPPKGPTPAVIAARVIAIAAVLGIGSWYAFNRYSDSIVLPVIDTYLPNPAEPGQTVTINGSGFGADPDPTIVKVMVGQAEATVLDAIPTRINITIPESLGTSGSQMLSLKITARGNASTSRLLKIAVIPKIASLTPKVALTGDEVTIAGKWLGNPKVKPTVTVAGNPAEILDAQPAQIRIKIPEVAATEGQRVSVKVAVGAETGREALLNFGRLPFVETITPSRSLPGDLVTLSGLGFAFPDLAVNVAGRSAVILSSSDSEVKFSVPGLRLQDNAGQKALAVVANEKTSIQSPLEVMRESSSVYSPRFFAEILEGGRAAVSCELGPVMVLGNDVPSRKRAHDAAARLNVLASQGRATRVLFTANDVTINAPGGPVLAVAGSDGAGNPRSLAPLWAAHLTDLFDLFLQGRRPGRAVELSADGRAVVDMFAAARRRSADPGVPLNVLFSPDPAWTRSLATLAAAPSLGTGQALALLDGYWAGVIEVPGAIQPRKVEISLSVTPSGLFGQRTSRQGKLSTDVSLQNLSFARRELRFSFVDSGENLNYEGRLDGDVIEGAVSRASGARVGKLNLKLSR